MKGRPPRVVVVTRHTEFEELLARHCTRAQAAFFLETRGQSIEHPEAAHKRFQSSLETVLHAVPLDWRRMRVDRGDLDRFMFRPDDVVIALGQDGLVANTAKYLEGQPVIGLNADPERNEGILVPHPPKAARDLLETHVAGRSTFERRTMVEVRLLDGQRLLALNEVFLGHRTHQSARYKISYGETHERQSSSGVIVSTGTGSSGWARSIRRNRTCEVALPEATEDRLAFFVREAWPSVATGTSICEGSIGPGQSLELTSRMNDGGVIFGDGIEADLVEFNWGQQVHIGLAETRLHLVR